MSSRRPTSTPSPGALAERLKAALDRRAPLLADPELDACRVVNGAADGLPGLVLERLGPALIAQVHEGRLAFSQSQVREICAAALERTGARAVYLKTFPRDRSRLRVDLEAQHHDARPWIGEPVPEVFEVREAGARFLVRPYDGYGTGLFLDHRSRRDAVRAHVKDCSVLNVFAYTCAFTVYAALGAARETLSVDASKRYLEWGKQNLTANGVALDRHRFICSDVFDYYRRAQRQGHRFDLIILDPPTFGRAKGSRHAFSVTEDLDRLVSGALTILKPRGQVLLVTNARELQRTHLEKALSSAAQAVARRVGSLTSIGLPGDFGTGTDDSIDVWARFD